MLLAFWSAASQALWWPLILLCSVIRIDTLSLGFFTTQESLQLWGHALWCCPCRLYSSCLSTSPQSSSTSLFIPLRTTHIFILRVPLEIILNSTLKDRSQTLASQHFSISAYQASTLKKPPADLPLLPGPCSAAVESWVTVCLGCWTSLSLLTSLPIKAAAGAVLYPSLAFQQTPHPNLAPLPKFTSPSSLPVLMADECTS